MSVIKDLEKRILELRGAYWNGNPLVSDVEYDNIFNQLKALDPNNTIFSEIEHGEEVGETIKHDKPMLSLEKVYSAEELFKWVKKVSRNENEIFLVQPKYDGISCRFDNGIFATRGNGEIGQNITNVCRNICKLETASNKSKFYGELVIRKTDFSNIYKNIKNGSGSNFKNSRNAVAGIIGTDDFSFYANQGATITLIDYEKNSFTATQKSFEPKWEILKMMIFALDFPLDGIVVKLADQEYSDSLGATSHHPKGQIAFKFENSSEWTKLITIDYGMGREQLTATAVFHPIQLGGVTITRAVIPLKSKTLPCVMNGDFARDTKLLVERAGDVIPHIIQVENELLGIPFELKSCPFCSASLDVGENSVVCSNPNCKERLIQQLFNGLKELGLKNIGEATVRTISTAFERGTFDKINLLNWFRWFNRNDAREKILLLPGSGEKSTQNIFNEINKLRTTTNEKFIAALCIPGVGTKIATEIMKVMDFGSLYAVEKDALSCIPSVGSIMAERIVRFFKTYLDYIIELRTFFTFEEKKVAVNSTGKSVCFTGTMRLPRKDMIKIAIDKGYTLSDSVNRNLGMLVVADQESLTSSKSKKALSYGVKVVTESDFLKM